MRTISLAATEDWVSSPSNSTLIEYSHSVFLSLFTALNVAFLL